MLFYGSGDEPIHNHITVALIGARVYIYVNLGDHPMNLTIGSNLNDDQ